MPDGPLEPARLCPPDPGLEADQQRIATRLDAGARRWRALADGFALGLAGPAFLLAGLFEAPLQVRRSSLGDTWARVGRQLRAGMSESTTTRQRDARG